ncbi:MAG: hypothetical protein R8K46_08540 [Mariprofundaceae bacterium]
MKRYLHDKLAKWLTRPLPGHAPDPFLDREALIEVLQPGDVLLVAGNTRVARIIQVLTKSRWSHAALYVGAAALHHPDDNVRAHARKHGDEAAQLFLEADIETGVTLIPLSRYCDDSVRICRPVGLDDKGRQALLTHGLSRLCEAYDTSQLLDLLRYLLPLAQLPAWLAQRLWMANTGEASRTICSTMLVEAFQAIHYPVLPEIPDSCDDRALCYRVRSARLFVPADFDLSPFFRIIKHQGIDHPRFAGNPFRPDAVHWL